MIEEDYETSRYTDLIENYNRDPLTYLKQYYTKYYHVSTDKIVNTTNKKRPLHKETVICVISVSKEFDSTAKRTEYKVRACLAGWIVEFNKRLLEDEGLLFRKPYTEGYIAIIKPKHENTQIALENCLTEDEYKASRGLD
ncbi:6299_t:CDS:2 [Paraglomus occultum]|uniref:Protein Abitram n=1 Tax=Paraglomus occultum TaxID=144539 RepID=A0A9N9G8L3_9GLOM|nr:6299_t:CDS:2 [Paraglomus occultum]